MSPDGLIVVEEILASDALRVELTTPDPQDETRRIAVEPRGRSWATRWEALERVLGPWTAEAGSRAR